MARRRAKTSQPVDRFQAALTRHYESVASAGKLLLYVTGSIVLGSIGLLLLKSASDRNEDAALETLVKIEAEVGDALYQANQRRRSFGRPPDPLIQRSFAQRYEKLAEDFGGVGAAPVALYRAAVLRFEAGLDSRTSREDHKKEMARVIADCEKVRRDFPTHVTAPLAYEQLGLAYEELGNREHAKRVYAEALDNYRDSFLYAKFRYHLGKSYWADRDMERAEKDLRQALSRTLDLDGNSEWRERAKFLLASIENERIRIRREGLLQKVPPLKPPETNGDGDAERAGDAPKDDALKTEKKPLTEKKPEQGDAPEADTPKANAPKADAPKGDAKSGADAKKEADDPAGDDRP